MARRVKIRDILGDPEERKELMIRTIIATQAREGIDVTREQAERAYEKVQEVIQEEPRRNDEQSLAAAEKGFKRFHSKKELEPIYPFHKNNDAVFELGNVDWPRKVGLVGAAMRTLYESDKWQKKPGKTVQYFHDHGKNVRFLAPGENFGEVEFPYDWPEEVMLIGECIGFVVRPEGTGEITEGVMKGKNILVASPDGWVNPRKPDRVFLAIINLNGGGVEGIIDGPNLRMTPHGIEG